MYQNKAIRVYYTNERESKKTTSSPTFIYLKGHNPPYHNHILLEQETLCLTEVAYITPLPPHTTPGHVCLI